MTPVSNNNLTMRDCTIIPILQYQDIHKDIIFVTPLILNYDGGLVIALKRSIPTTPSLIIKETIGDIAWEKQNGLLYRKS